jgi:type IV pilus assembly protein PilO
MDLRDSKTQKIGIAVLAFFIVVYFWYSRVYSNYDNQLQTKRQEFETVTTHLRNVEMKAKSLDALREEYGSLLDRYHEIESLLPEVKMIPSILVQLHTASSLTGTKITKVQPAPIGEESFYNVASFDVEMTGAYHDFGAFISYVANFPFIANISDMEIEAQNIALTGDETAESASQEVGKKPETITAKFTLSTYFVKEAERLQELEL